MRYSIRTLMILVLLVALPLGCVAIYDSVWRHHCWNLEASLCRHIITAEREQMTGLESDFEFELDGETYNSKPASTLPDSTDTLFVGIGHTGSDALSPPSLKFLDEVNVPGLTPMTGLDDEHPFFYIKIVRWVDWETVIVDYGSVDGPLAGGGADSVTYRHKDGTWELVDYGSHWVS